MLTTVYFITLGLKVLFREIDAEQEQKRRKVFTVVSLSLIAVFIVAVILIYVIHSFGIF